MQKGTLGDPRSFAAVHVTNNVITIDKIALIKTPRISIWKKIIILICNNAKRRA